MRFKMCSSFAACRLYVASLAAFVAVFRVAAAFGFFAAVAGLAFADFPFAAEVFAFAGAFAFAAGFFFLPFLAPASMRAAMSLTASSMVTASGAISLGSVAFTFPHLT